MTFVFAKGDKVRLRARPEYGLGVVTEIVMAGAEPQYEVMFSGAPQMFSGRHLELEDDVGDGVDPVSVFRSGELGSAQALRLFMTLAKLERPLADNLYSFAASRTERLPHQFKAVLKLLGNPYGRLLVADEVGLGKTIEAGIILTELGARRSLDHVLVACPSALTQKWRNEMRERFLLDFEVLDGAAFREFAAADRTGPAPEPRRVIASLELMRRAENLEALGTEAPNLDVVIVDEAHHARNSETSTNELAGVLGHLAETMVFLTATPLNLGRQDFFELMRLLVPQEFPSYDTFQDVIEPNTHINAALKELRSEWPPPYDRAVSELRKVETTAAGGRFQRSPVYSGVVRQLERGQAGETLDRTVVVRCQRDLIELNTLSHVFTRTRKREVQELFPTRRPHTVPVTFTDAERTFYDAVTEWVLHEYEDRAAHLVAATFQRLASSCLPAFGRRLTDSVRVGALTLGSDEAGEMADDGALGDSALDDALQGGQVELAVDRSTPLDRLLRAWDAYGGRKDSKYDSFEGALRESFEAGADRILVFSYFTGTIDYLAERLASVRAGGRPLRVLKLYGPMNAEAREAAVSAFRDDPGPVVLLSSEVGSEGLDFQFCARMFNYDLPWNPMRVEQRIGRLDRYGQASEVIHILNMIVSDTIEERIFFRLYERINIFKESIGDLEAILGELSYNIADLQRDALSGRLTAAELERRRNLVATVIVRQQQDNEVFERESQQFLSNDDVFTDLFNDIEQSRRYVTPEELHLLVSQYLTAGVLRARLTKAAGRPGVCRLEGDVARLRTQLAKALARETRGARAARHFLARLSDDGTELTFDPAVATADRRLEFISLHHSLIRAVAASAEVRAQSACCAALELDGVGEPCAFFVFEIEARGLKDGLELAAVAIRRDGSVVDGLGPQILAGLERAHDGTERMTAEAVDRAHQRALEWVALEVAGREQEMQEKNEATVSAQIESLRLTHDRRRLWLREQIESGRSEPIIRMRRAELGRVESEFAARLDRLEAKRMISVGYRLVAAGTVSQSG